MAQISPVSGAFGRRTRFAAVAVFLGAQLLGAGSLFADGLVAAWGDDSWGQTTLPIGVNNVKAIAAGFANSIALKSDGTIQVWGPDNGSGITNIPPGLTNVTAVSVGSDWGLALKADGTIAAWGAYNSDFNTAGVSNVTAIAAGWGHWLALKADGTVATAGDYVPAGLSNVVALAAGLSYSAFLKADGTVVTYGAGTNIYGYGAVPPGLSNVVAIAVGYQQTLAVKNDGTVVAWGDFAGPMFVPPGLSNVVAVAAGQFSNLALKADGTVTAWAADTNGFALDYDPGMVPSALANVRAIAAGELHNLALVFSGPVQITRDVSPLAQTLPLGANATYSVAANGSGVLGCQWFLNGRGMTNSARISGAQTATLNLANLQLGDLGTYTVVVSNAFGSVVSSGAALTVVSPPFIAAPPAANLMVGAGTNVTLAVSAQGTPPLSYQWLFDGAPLLRATNTVLSLTNVQPGLSGLYSLQITNVYGGTQVDLSLTVTDAAPYILSQPAGATATAGGRATLAVTARGSLPLTYQWAFNGTNLPGATNATLALDNLDYSQAGYYFVAVSNLFGSVLSFRALLSVGPTAVSFWTGGSYYAGAPTNIPSGLTNVAAVAVATYHGLALKTDGTVSVWTGLTNASMAVTNVPRRLTNVVAIAAGTYAPENSCLALKADGTVAAWGDGYDGVTNLPPAATNVVAIADGGDHCLALRMDGTVVGWGNNGYGQTTPPAGLSNVVAIAAGANVSLAALGDGTVVTWGAAQSLPPGLTNVIALAAASSGSAAGRMALRGDGTVVAWNGSASPAFPGNTNLAAIACGLETVALRSDGTVIAAPVSFPAGVSNVIAVAAAAANGTPGVVLTVQGNGSPFITLPPLSRVAAAGATVQFHARAVGAQPWVSIGRQQLAPQPLAYQWRFNGANISGATNSDLTLANLQGTNAGNYQVVVTNSLGAVTSRVAQLIVSGSGTPGVPATALLTAARLAADGSFVLSVQNGDGSAVPAAALSQMQVQYSTNLVNWAPLPGATVLPNGQVQIQAPPPAGAARCFYRLVGN